MDIEKLVKTTVEELEKLVSTETIIGKPQTFEGNMVIPVCKVGFGFGVGGGSGTGKENECGGGEGSGAGAGASITPVALVAVDEGGVQVISLSGGGLLTTIENIAKQGPDIINKLRRNREEKSDKKAEKKIDKKAEKVTGKGASGKKK